MNKMLVLIAIMVCVICATPASTYAATESQLSAVQELTGYSFGNWSLVGVVHLETGSWVWGNWFSSGWSTINYTLLFDDWLFGAIWDDWTNDWGEGIYLISQNL